MGLDDLYVYRGSEDVRPEKFSSKETVLHIHGRQWPTGKISNVEGNPGALKLAVYSRRHRTYIILNIFRIFKICLENINIPKPRAITH